MKRIYTLEDVFKELKVSLDKQNFKEMDIEGEVDNYKRFGNMARFTLKDKDIKLDIILFGGAISKLEVNLEDGMQVICTGDLSVYPTESKYQLNCSQIQETGSSKYEYEFQKLYAKLNTEGIFKTSKDKKVPSAPRSIGIACKKDSEGFKDIIAIWKERYPWVKLVHSECEIQGKSASSSILRAIKKLEQYQVDVIVVARGGGDKLVALFPYNNETLVRYIANMSIPIISGIGHESDFTLVDYVAAVRGATPSHAAVLASIDKETFISRMTARMMNIHTNIQSQVNLVSTRVQEHNMKELKKILLEQILFEKSNLKGQAMNLQKETNQICKRNKNEIGISVQRMDGKFSKSLITVRHSIEKRNTLIELNVKEQLRGYRGELSDIDMERLHIKLKTDVEKYKSFARKGIQREYIQVVSSLNHYKEDILRNIENLEACSIKETLKRGYAIILNEDKQMITEIEDLTKTSRIVVEMKDGKREFYIQVT